MMDIKDIDTPPPPPPRAFRTLANSSTKYKVVEGHNFFYMYESSKLKI